MCSLLVINLLVLIHLVTSAPFFDENYGRRIFDKGDVCKFTPFFNLVARPGTLKHYLIADIQLGWIDAETYCEKYGGHLPSVANKVENEYLRYLVSERVKQHQSFIGHDFLQSNGYWLGAYQSVVTGEWKWSDGSVFEYTNWIDEESKESKFPEFFLHDTFENEKFIGWNVAIKDTSMFVVCQIDCQNSNA